MTSAYLMMRNSFRKRNTISVFGKHLADDSSFGSSGGIGESSEVERS